MVFLASNVDSVRTTRGSPLGDLMVPRLSVFVAFQNKGLRSTSISSQTSASLSVLR